MTSTILTPDQKEDYAQKYVAYQKRRAAAKRRWHHKSKERMRAKQRDIYHADVEKHRQRSKEYYAANKQQKKDYYEANKEVILEKRKVRRRQLAAEKAAASESV